MKFEISINTDNSAFVDAVTGEQIPYELARLLRVVAGRVEEGETTGKLRDFNGNTVGSFGYDDEVEE